MRKEIIRVIKDTALESYIHGLAKIVRSNNSIPIKITWVLCILSSIVVCFVLVALNVIDYFKFEVITKIQILQEIPAVFPTVTLCNYNAFTTSYSKQFNANSERNLADYYGLFHKEYLPKMVANNLNDSEKKLLGLSIEEMLLSCYFAGDPCKGSDFKWVYNYNYGNCFIFNSNRTGSIKKLTRSGNGNGLILELYTGANNDINDFDHETGMLVFLSNITQNYFENSGVALPNSFRTKFLVNRFFHKKINYPYSDCVTDTVSSQSTDLFKLTKSLNVSYSQSMCMDLCFQQFVIENCSCHDPRYAALTSTRQCLTKAEYICVLHNYRQYLQGGFNQKCLVECKPECSKETFEYMLSSINYPAETYAGRALMESQIVKSKYQNRSLSYEELKSKVLAVDISYHKLDYTIISEVENMSFITLVSNIGGVLGLCLGMSFLSFIEIFELFFELGYAWLKVKSDQKKAKFKNQKKNSLGTNRMKRKFSDAPVRTFT